MKKEGEIRIPSGCAIAAVISREGRRMTGEKIMESMVPMHDRSNGWAEDLPAMEFIRNIGTFMRFIYFITMQVPDGNVKTFSKRPLKS